MITFNYISKTEAMESFPASDNRAIMERLWVDEAYRLPKF
jgi:hypothetical protein